MMAMFMVYSLLAQQQLANPGFENWEDAGTVKDEPVKWSSIKTSDAGDFVNNAAPVVWGRSSDAHTGDFSVELTNVLTIGTIIATGTITNGRVHADFDPTQAYVFTDQENDQWHGVMTQRPDSVAIWAKYYPQGNDTAQVKVLLHTDEGTLPPFPDNEANIVGLAQINIVETVDAWTRFVAPIDYVSEGNPEYVLTILSSGAGLTPIDGSIARYDDIEFIYGSQSIGENSEIDAMIYTAGNTICLDKLPQSELNGATLEIMNLNGQLVYSAKVKSNRTEIGHGGFTSGLYVVRILTKNTNYSQKIYLD